jgi:hypothetical protein
MGKRLQKNLKDFYLYITICGLRVARCEVKQVGSGPYEIKCGAGDLCRRKSR